MTEGRGECDAMTPEPAPSCAETGGGGADGVLASFRLVCERLSALEALQDQQGECARCLDGFASSLQHLEEGQAELRRSLEAKEEQLGDRIQALASSLQEEVAGSREHFEQRHQELCGSFKTVCGALEHKVEGLRNQDDAQLALAALQEDLSTQERSMAEAADYAEMRYRQQEEDTGVKLQELRAELTGYTDTKHRQQSEAMIELLRDMGQRISAEIVQAQTNSDNLYKTHRDSTRESLKGLELKLSRKIDALSERALKCAGLDDAERAGFAMREEEVLERCREVVGAAVACKVAESSDRTAVDVRRLADEFSSKLGEQRQIMENSLEVLDARLRSVWDDVTKLSLTQQEQQRLFCSTMLGAQREPVVESLKMKPVMNPLHATGLRSPSPPATSIANGLAVATVVAAGPPTPRRAAGRCASPVAGPTAYLSGCVGRTSTVTTTPRRSPSTHMCEPSTPRRPPTSGPGSHTGSATRM